MEALFSVVRDVPFGFFGLLLLLLVLALLFGKRFRTRPKFEAKFRDMSEREFGEFEIKLHPTEKVEHEYASTAKFRMRHEALEKGREIEVYVDDIFVMRGTVTKSGHVLLRQKAVMNPRRDPRKGQHCRIVWGGIEQFRAPIRPD